jgi:polar amino acid transport system substrate-binding protein
MATGRGFGLACALLAASAAQAQPREMRFVTEALPPYSYLADDQPAGPMVDVLQAACARLGWRCSVEILPWRRALRIAQAGEVQGLFCVVTPPTTRPRFHVSPAVIDARYMLFARAGHALQFDGDARQLAGRRVGVYGPSAAEDSLRALIQDTPDARAEIETDNRIVLRKLAAGRYGEDGLAVANEAVAQQLIREDAIGGLRIAGVVKSFGYAFGLNRERVSAADARAFATALQELCRSGRTAELLKPYGLPASPCPR